MVWRTVAHARLLPHTQHIVTHEVRLGGEQPVLLHGGGLLGVVLNKPHASGTGAGGLPWLPLH